MLATFWLATTLPVTLAMNMTSSCWSTSLQQFLNLTGHDDLFVGRHDPQLDPALMAMNRHLTPGAFIAERIEQNAEPIQVGADRGPQPRGVHPDPARKNNGIGSIQQQQIRPQVMPHRGYKHIQG